MSIQEKTREELYAESTFEWIKTDRSGDICKFDKFDQENSTEYVYFVDGTRIRTSLIGDVVLMHPPGSEIIGNELALPGFRDLSTQSFPQAPTNFPKIEQSQVIQVNPVVAIFEKSRKRTETLKLNLTVKIPHIDLYHVMRDNFGDVDDILLSNVMEQIQENVLKEAIRKQLLLIYPKNRRK